MLIEEREKKDVKSRLGKHKEIKINIAVNASGLSLDRR